MLRACVFLALLLIAAAPVTAQEPPSASNTLLAFEVEIPEPVAKLDINGAATVDVIVRDVSKDGVGGLAGGSGPSVITHEVTFSVTPQINDPGWSMGPPSTLYMQSGDVAMTQASFTVVGATKLETYIANVTIQFRSLQGGGDPEYLEVTIGARTEGFVTFVTTVKDTPLLKPRETTQVRLEIQNLGLFDTSFDFEVTENTCGIPVVLPRNVYAGPKATVIATVELSAPWKDKLWYFTENCGLGIKAYPTGQEDVFSTNSAITVQVDGQSIFHIEKLFPLFVVLLLVLLLILFIVRRKSRIEEELLGKPQKPWTIPVEALYLRALRHKDERAWYVVRHHLMEEEYRSSLLWYGAYKKATRGNRKKESMVLRQEKSYESWKAKWHKAIAKPMKVADKFEAKLQRKLDRKARKADRKDARKVRKLTKKMSAAHGKQVERALEKWQKQTKKAAKKGFAAPQRPVLPEPDYPEEPESRSFVLSEHKWSKKAARFRARRVREQGNLEVKFEKADARRLAQVRRKVLRVARKLDDPDFVAEHPLLRSDG